MTDKPVQYREIAHLPLGDRIDLVCDAFERERRRGLVRPLEDYVQEVPEPERDAFLSELRTVEQALSNASTVMEGEPTGSLVRPLEAPPEPLVPEQLGRYQVEELLGRGGFGEVWKCFDPELKRHVAVKVLLRERFASDQEVARFLDEARKLAQLRHPGIVAIYDVGCQGGYVFLVSEYVPGGTLHDRLQNGPLPPAEAAELLAKVAEAVHYAHKRGLVHRDLKPGNILIDSDGQPRVADFGLAVHEDEQRRRAGEIAGTPAYMAPEQVRGETHLLDGRADVWAIGVILYQCLTGRRPFGGDTREELFAEILHRDPKPIAQTLDLPGYEHICATCLRKHQVDRYSSAADLSRALRAIPARSSAARGWTRLRWYGIVAVFTAMLSGLFLYGMRPGYNDVLVKADGELLANKPIVLLGADTNLSWNPETRLADVTTTNEAVAVSLISIDHGSYVLELTLSNLNGSGSASPIVGVFLGFRQEVADGQPCHVFQAIRFTTGKGPSRVRVQRLKSTLILQEDGSIVVREDPISPEVTVEMRRDCRLRLEVAENTLRSIRWHHSGGHQELFELTSTDVNERTSPKDFVGPAGIMVWRGTITVQSAKITHPSPE